MGLQKRPDVRFLSQLYAEDVPDAVLLAEYPSSNSDETRFQNRTRFIIHDPFPPPRRELMKVLGPHHLMCGWGRDLPVSSDVRPPDALIAHWERLFSAEACPVWQTFDPADQYITLFPHESIRADRQVVDPAAGYAVHSKEVIERIDCPQADVLSSIQFPCIVKLSHGYAGLGNFLIRNSEDEANMRQAVDVHWPGATLVINSVIEEIAHDVGVQFYLAREGSLVWLGVTQQHFDTSSRWCGGSFSASFQDQVYDQVGGMMESVGSHLHSSGYFGLVGIDVLFDRNDRQFLVDVNPRLTGISPFLMLSRFFAEQGLTEGIYRASARFKGSLDDLIAVAEKEAAGHVVVLSAFEEPESEFTICHISANSHTQQQCCDILNRIT